MTTVGFITEIVIAGAVATLTEGHSMSFAMSDSILLKYNVEMQSANWA